LAIKNIEVIKNIKDHKITINLVDDSINLDNINQNLN